MLLFLIVAEAGLFTALDRQAYDLGLQFTSSKDVHEDIVVIAIDDKSYGHSAPGHGRVT